LILQNPTGIGEYCDLDNGNPAALHKEFSKSKLVIVPGDHNGTYKTAAFSKAIMSFL